MKVFRQVRLPSSQLHPSPKLFHTTPLAAMPLVVPGMMSTESSDQGNKDEWMFKLAGKKISDSTSDVNVSLPWKAKLDLLC